MIVRRTVMLRGVVLTATVGPVSAATVSEPPPPPPPTIPTLPKGPMSSCAITGPAWALYGVHTPNAPPRRGDTYRVKAWGIPCSKASALLRAFFPKIPPHPTGRLAGGPAGFTCRGLASGLAKNRMYAGSCLRITPATTFSWEPVGGK